MISKFNSLYETAVISLNQDLMSRLKEIEIESREIEDVLNSRIVLENDLSIGKKIASLLSKICNGLQKAASSNIDTLKIFLKKIYNNSLTKKIINALFGNFINSNKILSSKVIKEQAATVTLTQEQFNELVNKTAESAKTSNRSGFFGKILGFVVDHFFGIVKILALVAVAYICIFNPELGKSIYNNIVNWISEFIANNQMNVQKIQEKLSNSILSKDAIKKWAAGAKDATKSMVDSYRNASKDFQNVANDMKNASIKAYSKSTINQNIAGSVKANLQADWLEKMQSIYDQLKASNDPSCPENVTKMGQWIRDNRPDLWNAKMKAIKDATKNPEKFKGLDAYISSR